jgi:exopolyphosphatase / guanosine-5'-triphosphate,3'-diphosphate pyrophosphatase
MLHRDPTGSLLAVQELALPAAECGLMPSALPLHGPLAAVDLGSNSFRLEIGHVQRGRYQRLASLKETPRLGAGLDARGRLSDEAIARGLQTVQRFAAHLRGVAPAQVRAVATQTLREARNGQAFLRPAERLLGHAIEVISGDEEARLIYAGVARLQPSRRKRLVVDIGGRSTELIVGQGLQALAVESLAVGSVGLSLQFFPDGRLTAPALRAAQLATAAALDRKRHVFDRQHWSQALGASGTVGAVSQVLQAAGCTDGRVTPDALRWCMQACLRAGHVDRVALPGLREDRRALVPGGLAILYTLASQLGIEALQPAQGALRQGLLFDLAQRQPALALKSSGREPSPGRPGSTLTCAA